MPQFARAGFPGPEREFESAMRLLAPAAGGHLVDASCGSGLFTRQFVRSGRFSAVTALDFSESMLRQTQEYLRADDLGRRGGCGRGHGLARCGGAGG